MALLEAVEFDLNSLLDDGRVEKDGASSVELDDRRVLFLDSQVFCCRIGEHYLMKVFFLIALRVSQGCGMSVLGGQVFQESLVGALGFLLVVCDWRCCWILGLLYLLFPLC